MPPSAGPIGDIRLAAVARQCDVVSVGAMRLDCPHSDGAPLSSMQRTSTRP